MEANKLFSLERVVLKFSCVILFQFLPEFQHRFQNLQINFTLEQVTKAQSGSRVIALHFL